jgi:hypothetical protein
MASPQTSFLINLPVQMSSSPVGHSALKMRMHALFLVVVFSLCHGARAANVFCGTFPAAPVSGYFVASFDDRAQATYSFAMTIDVATFLVSCPGLTSGLKFHLHSIWAGNSSSQGTLTSCGPSTTSGHYDPNLACGSSSTWATTNCTLLNRSTAQGYGYSCTSTNFARRPGACEIGDLSGKFGLAQVTAGTSDQTKLDVLPPTADRYLRNDPLSPYVADFAGSAWANTGWTSVVFHCNDAASTRLFCSELRAVSSWSDCVGNALPDPAASVVTPSPVYVTPPTEQGGVFDSAGSVLILIAALVIGGLLGVAAGWFARSKANRRHAHDTLQ